MLLERERTNAWEPMLLRLARRGRPAHAARLADVHHLPAPHGRGLWPYHLRGSRLHLRHHLRHHLVEEWAGLLRDRQ